MSSLEMFKLGMRRLVSGVTLVTTCHEGVRHGLVATAVTSVTGDPPTLLICVNKSASAHAPLAAARIFCVNVLADDHGDVARQFSSPLHRDERFGIGDWVALATGAPALRGCLAAFDCEAVELIPYNSHTIFLGKIRKIELWRGKIDPLLYVDGMYRKLADPDGRVST